MRLFISAGEPSGDLHAANLVRSIRARRPEAELVGFGGPHLEAAGARLIYPLVELAVMWFGRVLLHLPKFFRLAYEAERVFRDERPDAVVLIDYPGFHWHLAKRAKRHGIPVFYYVPPQLWAWAGWRVKKVRRWVDHVLCSLPFEPEWYRSRGVDGAVHVGHPYFDELAERMLDAAFLDEQRDEPGRVVALLPGSRTQEVLKNLPMMYRAADTLSRRRNDVRFVVSCLHDRHRELAGRLLIESGLRLDRLTIHAGRTAELIRLAECAWAVSGSVGLELMAEGLPTVVIYRIRPHEMRIARPFIKAKFISLVNLLAESEVMPEYLTDRDVSTEMAEWAERWLADPIERANAAGALSALRDRVAKPGASERAAEIIVSELSGLRGTLAGSHRHRAEVPQSAMG